MKTKLALIGTLLVCLLTVGLAFVAAQGGGVIFACEAKDGSLRRVTDPSECKDKETPLEWYDTSGVDSRLRALGGRLAAALNAETVAREGADADLQSQIDTMGNPDPPCFDNHNRYVDCGNGTVHDTLTGLLWLKDASCLGKTDYASANNAAAAMKDGDCGLADNSSPGDWRLPSPEEWNRTIHRAVKLGCVSTPPTLTNATGTDCYDAGPQSFVNIQSDAYWSSTTDPDYSFSAFDARLHLGFVNKNYKSYSLWVWPVRGSRDDALHP